MIQNPRLTGIYHWMTGDIRNVGFLYKTSEYEGKLISSEEGKVYWISGEQFLKKPLAPGMEQVWQMMHDENAQVQLTAVKSLGKIGDDHATAQLQWLLSQTSEDKKELIAAIHDAIKHVKNKQ